MSRSARYLLGGVAVVLLAVLAVRYWPRNVETVPQPDLAGADPEAVELIERTRSQLLARRRSADAWGKFGMVLRAHGFAAEANECFSEASRLDPAEPRWPYL